MKCTPSEDLINSFLKGDDEAFAQIVARYNRPLRYFAWTMVKSREAAEEIANDSFFKLWQSRSNFDTLEAIKSFLYVVTRNACLNYVKSPRNRLRGDMAEAELLLSNEQNVETRLIETELLDSVYREVQKLPAKQREVFRLLFIEGLNVEETAQELDITANAVYLNKSLAIKSLQQAFRHYDVTLYLLFLAFLWKN